MIHTKIDQVGEIKSKLQPIPRIKSRLSGKETIETRMEIPKYIPVDTYDGATVIVPSCYFDQELYTKGKLVKSDITVKKIPYYETTNETGITIYIGNEDLVIFEGGN